MTTTTTTTPALSSLLDRVCSEEPPLLKLLHWLDDAGIDSADDGCGGVAVQQRLGLLSHLVALPFIAVPLHGPDRSVRAAECYTSVKACWARHGAARGGHIAGLGEALLMRLLTHYASRATLPADEMAWLMVDLLQATATVTVAKGVDSAVRALTAVACLHALAPRSIEPLTAVAVHWLSPAANHDRGKGRPPTALLLATAAALADVFERRPPLIASLDGVVDQDTMAQLIRACHRGGLQLAARSLLSDQARGRDDDSQKQRLLLQVALMRVLTAVPVQQTIRRSMPLLAVRLVEQAWQVRQSATLPQPAPIAVRHEAARLLAYFVAVNSATADSAGGGKLAPADRVSRLAADCMLGPPNPNGDGDQLLRCRIQAAHAEYGRRLAAVVGVNLTKLPPLRLD